MTATRAGALLRGAAEIVDGARNATHGDKERSFTAIAALWTAYLNSKPHQGYEPITPADVAAMMVLLKFARSEHGQHIEDHGTDAVGYAAIWGELRESEASTTQDAPQRPVDEAGGLRPKSWVGEDRKYGSPPSTPRNNARACKSEGAE